MVLKQGMVFVCGWRDRWSEPGCGCRPGALGISLRLARDSRPDVSWRAFPIYRDRRDCLLSPRAPRDRCRSLTRSAERVKAGPAVGVLRRPGPHWRRDRPRRSRRRRAGCAVSADDRWGRRRATHVLGAKHMVTGYDHLLFLAGVVFFLYRAKEVLLYVSLFTVGHSSHCWPAQFGAWRVNPYLIDAVIGLSVVYKAFENMGGLRMLFAGRLIPCGRLCVWLVSRAWLGRRSSRILALTPGLSPHRQLQSRRRNRSDAGLDVRAHGPLVLAQSGQLLATGIRGEPVADDRRLHPDGLPTDRILFGDPMTTQAMIELRPTPARLARATITAIGAAGVILLTIVLPAEFRA